MKNMSRGWKLVLFCLILYAIVTTYLAVSLTVDKTEASKKSTQMVLDMETLYNATLYKIYNDGDIDEERLKGIINSIEENFTEEQIMQRANQITKERRDINQ